MQDRIQLKYVVRLAHRVGCRVELSWNGLLNIIDHHGRTIGKDLEVLEASYRLDMIFLTTGEVD